MQNKVVKLNTSYYVQHAQSLVQLGMNDLTTDTDVRQRKVWDYIKENNLTVRIEVGYDFENKLGPRSSPNYKYFQARHDCEKPEKIEELYEMFYTLGEPMKRAIIGFEMEDGLFPSVGNHRARTHRKAQVVHGHNSKGNVMIIGDGLTDDLKRKHGLEIAAISNYETDDDVDRECEEDIIHQATMAWNLMIQSGEVSGTETVEQKTAIMKEWICQRKPKYKLANRAGRLSGMTNSMFASHRCQSLPFPDDVDINIEFKKFWPNSTWKPSASGKVQQRRVPCRAQFVAYELGLLWRSREVASQVRDKVWVAARAGTSLEANITSTRSIQLSRANFIKTSTKSNTNPNHVLGGYPLVERVLFVKQADDDEYEAWEWNTQTEEFDQL